MSTDETPETTTTAVPPDARKARNPVRRWVAIILLVCVLVFGYSLIADRLTPYTPQGIVANPFAIVGSPAAANAAAGAS